jgi:hypothetical protein
MAHTLALEDGQIRIRVAGGDTQRFADTAAAAEHLAAAILATGVATLKRDGSLDAPAAHGRPTFRYERFVHLVRERVTVLERLR